MRCDSPAGTAHLTSGRRRSDAAARLRRRGEPIWIEVPEPAGGANGSSVRMICWLRGGSIPSIQCRHVRPNGVPMSGNQRSESTAAPHARGEASVRRKWTSRERACVTRRSSFLRRSSLEAGMTSAGSSPCSTQPADQRNCRKPLLGDNRCSCADADALTEGDPRSGSSMRACRLRGVRQQEDGEVHQSLQRTHGADGPAGAALRVM
jgi:hypothetical protein